MKRLSVEGILQKDLDLCVDTIAAIQDWAKKEKVDRWAFRAALLKALFEDAENYFEETKGNYREIAAFDNGVANTLDSLKES